MRPRDAAPQPAPGTCAQWLKTKHKFCSWPTLGGSVLCRHHTTEDRVPCPVDPGHTVLSSTLAQHVLVCTRAREAAAIATAPYVHAACNAGSDDDDDDNADSAGATLWRLLPDDEAFPAALADVREVASLVLAAVARLPAVPAPAMIPDCVSAAAARLEETARDVHTTDPWDEKHSAQHIGILAAMHTHGLLHSGDGTVFAELGAGRGYLLNALAVCVGPPCRLLFVERRAYRNKAERSLRRRTGIEVARARCDVADLDLEQAIATLFDGAPERAPDTVIVLAKHLCGSATDMALRCAIRCARAGNCKLGGLAMAPCCHHACSWKAFVNKDFLKVHGIGRRQFSILKRLASWCVDSHGGGRAPSTEADEDDRLSRWGYPPGERARIGTAVKRFLDTGRAEWLARQRGGPAASEASLVSYVDAGITPENRLVVWRS